MNRTSLLVMALALSGCLDAVALDLAKDRGATDQEEIAPDRFGARFVRGDVGDVRALWDDAPLVEGWRTDEFAWIDLRAERQAGGEAGILSLTIEGGLENPVLQPGAYFPLKDDCVIDPVTIPVIVTGRSEDRWAEREYLRGTVQVFEGRTAGAITLFVDGAFDDDRVASAAVEIVR